LAAATLHFLVAISGDELVFGKKQEMNGTE
jgi:hypothetical protein